MGFEVDGGAPRGGAPASTRSLQVRGRITTADAHHHLPVRVKEGRADARPAPRPSWPKPLAGVNAPDALPPVAVHDQGKNAFYDPGPWQLSTVARAYMGGLLEHARAFVAVTNPLVNSYKRLVRLRGAGHVAWSEKNRSAR